MRLLVITIVWAKNEFKSFLRLNFTAYCGAKMYYFCSFNNRDPLFCGGIRFWKNTLYVSGQFTPRFRMNFCENSVKSNKYNTVIHLPENNSQKKYRQHYCYQFFGAKKISKRSYAPHLFTTERFHLRHSEKTGLSLKCHFQFSYLCYKNYYSSIFWWLWVRKLCLNIDPIVFFPKYLK